MSDKKGYLEEEFRIFRLKDSLGGGGNLHYHEFNKLVFFMSGRVKYIVDGDEYPLSPGDVLLVRRCALHRAEIDVSEPYERVIVYIDEKFAVKYNTFRTELLRCFSETESRGCLIRPDTRSGNALREIVSRVESAKASENYGADVLAETAMAEMLVYINRMKLMPPQGAVLPGTEADGRIRETLEYISENLRADLSVGALASRSFFSRYYFMRLFREATGRTVHDYVREKRLMNAAGLITQGVPASRAAAVSGFGDYSAFERAFKAVFSAAPSEFKRAGISETPERE